MATAVELPTVDTLREEQRAIRAVLVRLTRRLGLELLLELAADALIVLAIAAAILVFLDWWLRFGLAVRLILLVITEIGVLAFLGVRALKRFQASRLDELTLAMTLDRHRPGTGQQIADVLQLPELLDSTGGSSSPAMVRLAVGRATAALAGSDWRIAVEPQAHGACRGRIDRRPGHAGGLRCDRTKGGPAERRPLALPFVAALAAANVSHGDGLERRGDPAGAS